ncbi:type IV secretion system DNA-binding domain-containing protein, partial [Cysteiniphilum litorale]|uniref:type IV secretion system DNA-binding domain-containing protein n=1 Tax=Cysteiniphilum litorale TaxID=2056700 RepID=UPI003F8832A6
MFKLFTRSGQIFFHNWRMLKQVLKTYFIAYFLLLILSFCAIAYYTANKYEVASWKAYYIAKMTVRWTDNPLQVIGMNDYGHAVIKSFTRRHILTNPYFKKQSDTVNHQLYWAFMMPFYGLTALFLGFAFVLTRRTKAKYSGETLVRGARVESTKVVNKILKAENRLSPLKIGQQHLVYESEVKHIVLHGTTGTGKTVIVKDLLHQIRPRHHRAVILDDGGAYTQAFYDESRGDVILNPFDTRCPNWNAWDECVETIDYDNFAAALIPDEADKDKFWVQSARNLLSSLMQEMKKRGQTSYESLLQHCLNFPLEKLQEVLKDTPAEQLVDGDIAKTAITIRAIITNHVKALRFLPQESSRAKFSFRDWVMNEHKGACVFVVIRDKDVQAIRSLISLWIGLLTTHVKSLERSHQRRIWLILDELMKLNRLTSLPDTLATGRNYGLSCILGIQNKAQLRSTYGRDEAQAIFDLLSTQV